MTTSTTLVVIKAFSSYNVSDRITDGATVTSILASAYATYVVATNVPPPVTSGGVSTVAVGTDNSWNQPALPAGSPLEVVDINPFRQNVKVTNATDQDLLLVFDDGNGGALTIEPLASVAAYAQGAAWESPFFKGRIRIFPAIGGIPNGQIPIHQD